MDGVSALAALRALDGIGTVAVILIVGWLIATGRLVTRREHEAVKQQRDRFEHIAMRSLGLADALTAPVEATAEAWSRLPDPGAEKEETA